MGGMAGMPMAAHGDMQGTSMAGHHMKGMNMSGQGGGMDMSGGMQMSSMSMRDFDNAPGVKKGAGVSTIAPMPKDRTGEPGQGLENVGHRVLAYTNLVALERNPDTRAASRSLDVRRRVGPDGQGTTQPHDDVLDEVPDHTQHQLLVSRAAVPAPVPRQREHGRTPGGTIEGR